MKRMIRIPVLMVCLLVVALLIWGVGDQPRALADDTPRLVEFSKVTLKTQDNKEVNVYDNLFKDKVVVINFMYTECKGPFCREGMKNLVKVQNALGDQLGRDVFMYSITLEPTHDGPNELKRYAEEIGVKPGWTLLTGKAEDITNLRRKLGLFDTDPKVDADVTQHSGVIKIGNVALNKWTSTSILAKPDRILQMIERVMPPKK